MASFEVNTFVVNFEPFRDEIKSSGKISILRPNATSCVKINFRTKMMLLLCKEMFAHIIPVFSMIIKKLVKMKILRDSTFPIYGTLPKKVSFRFLIR